MLKKHATTLMLLSISYSSLTFAYSTSQVHADWKLEGAPESVNNLKIPFVISSFNNPGWYYSFNLSTDNNDNIAVGFMPKQEGNYPSDPKSITFFLSSSDDNILLPRGNNCKFKDEKGIICEININAYDSPQGYSIQLESSPVMCNAYKYTASVYQTDFVYGDKYIATIGSFIVPSSLGGGLRSNGSFNAGTDSNKICNMKKPAYATSRMFFNKITSGTYSSDIYNLNSDPNACYDIETNTTYKDTQGVFLDLLKNYY